jgi:hypothetical protein
MSGPVDKDEIELFALSRRVVNPLWFTAVYVPMCDTAAGKAGSAATGRERDHRPI